MSSGWAEKNYPKQVYELAAAQRYDGAVQLWVLDMKSQIWTTWQASPGGDWHPWQGPGWNNVPASMKLKKIAATQLAGGHGLQFWGITDDGVLVGCYQITPSGRTRRRGDGGKGGRGDGETGRRGDAGNSDASPVSVSPRPRVPLSPCPPVPPSPRPSSPVSPIAP